jgi:hypothetical protein
MLRKMILSALLGLTALTGLTATAQAAPAGHERYQGGRFRVYFRRDCHCGWQCISFRCWEEGEREACRLRHLGYEVMTIRS